MTPMGVRCASIPGKPRDSWFHDSGRQLCFLGCLALAFVGGLPRSSARSVIVGVYDNYPKVFVSEDGRPSGFFIGLLEQIAGAEGWRLEYRVGTWAECLTRLGADEIDLMPDVAFSEARDAQFDFNQLTVISEWQQVYARKGMVLQEIGHLNGKTVVILENSLSQRTFPELIDRLGISVNLLVQGSYDEMIKAVVTERADAMVASRFFSFSRHRSDRILPTPLVFEPSRAGFATRKGRNADLLLRLDANLSEMMNDPDSPYFALLHQWLREEPNTLTPRYLLWLVAAIGAIAAVIFFVAILFRSQVRAKTRQLKEQNQRLEAALAELERAREEALQRERLHAFGQLASGLAHDFNNLLSPICGCVALLRASPGGVATTAETVEYLDVIEQASMKAAELTARMTAFCRTRELEGRIEQVDPNGVIQEVVALAHPRLRKPSHGRGSSVCVRQELEASTSVEGNPGELREIVLNLVLNALDAMPDGGELTLGTSQDSDSVRLYVRDSGTGMSAEVRARCLSPFFSTKGARGTGMGLAMVNSITTRYGGRVEVESEQGKGSTFTLVLPKGASA